MITGVNAALESLRELSHGVFPSQLARAGLEPSLRSYLRRRGHGSSLEIAPDVLGLRFAARVEAAVYFAVTRAEGTGPGRGAVILALDENELHCTVIDAVPDVLDLHGIRDRVEAVGGSLRLSEGSLEVRIPLTPTSPTAP
jgi:signal transduction histidine kinase